MGFSDLLTSSRGPGVVGTVVALFVLVGYSALYVLVFDEGLQGGGTTLEGVIRGQALTIEAYKDRLEGVRERLAAAEQLAAQSTEIKELETLTERTSARIAELSFLKEQAASSIAATLNEWEIYKDRYRAAERSRAVGESLGDVKLADGRVLFGVNIRSVDFVGINVWHREGITRVSFEDLPVGLQDRFQFDEEQAEEALRVEEELRHQITAAVAAVDNAALEKDLEARVAREMADEEKMKRLRRAMIPERINSLKREVARMEEEIRTEQMRGLRGRIPGLRKAIVRAKINIESLEQERKNK